LPNFPVRDQFNLRQKCRVRPAAFLFYGMRSHAPGNGRRGHLTPIEIMEGKL